jgi:hypothetical protein
MEMSNEFKRQQDIISMIDNIKEKINNLVANKLFVYVETSFTTYGVLIDKTVEHKIMTNDEFDSFRRLNPDIEFVDVLNKSTHEIYSGNE